MKPGTENLKRLVPEILKRPYRRLKGILSSNGQSEPYIKEIDLRQTLMGGEGTYDAREWAEITGRVSALLKDSVHVKFLEQYRAIEENVFIWENFEQTAYFKNAVQCVQFWGDYFGQRTREEILAQARSFAVLYECIRDGNPSEVRFPSEKDHAPPRSLPRVRETLTPGTVEIADGHHRLAIAWVLGQRKAMALVIPSPTATTL
jgi:hypothetical protein